jgi:hypothetical protein
MFTALKKNIGAHKFTNDRKVETGGTVVDKIRTSNNTEKNSSSQDMINILVVAKTASKSCATAVQ